MNVKYFLLSCQPTAVTYYSDMGLAVGIQCTYFECAKDSYVVIMLPAVVGNNQNVRHIN